MKPQYNTPLNLVVAILLCFIAGGCTSLESIVLEPTVPNEPYSGPYPSSFNELADKNPLLAHELAKLPELQDGISEEEALALSVIVKLYNDDPVAFETAFSKMYKIGIPEVRKYCSPLQALFWLVEDGKLNEAKNFVFQDLFILEKLLEEAWALDRYPPFPIKISEREFSEVLAGIKDEQRKNYYIDLIRDDDPVILAALYLDYDLQSNIFSSKARKILQGYIVSDPRWGNIEVVVDRLNAPELLDYYINSSIAYRYSPRSHRSFRSVINERFGDCADLANLGRAALTKAGYDAFGRFLGEFPNDHIVLGIKLEDGSYFLAVDFNQTGNHMKGPYKTLLELDQAVGYGSRYKSREPFVFERWGFLH